MMRKSPLLVKSERDEPNHYLSRFQGINLKNLSQPVKSSLLEKAFMIMLQGKGLES
jgi:hypothetical protein